jgi:hypothetical protein
MKTTTTFILTLLTCFLSVFASVDPPSSINLIRPDPNTPVPHYSNVTFGFASPQKEFFGLIQDVKMSYQQPDGSVVQSSSFGPDNAVFQPEGYNPHECRTFPGVSTINQVNASQVGKYVLFPLT